MQRFYKDFNQFRVRQIHQMLSDAGIPCTIQNEFLAGASGEIPHHEALPEVWLLDAEWAPKAQALLAEFEHDISTHGVDDKDWQCRVCEQLNEPQFRMCWQCDALRGAVDD
jgi:hypothetical protein